MRQPDLFRKVLVFIVLVILWGTIAWFLWPKEAASAAVGLALIAGAPYPRREPAGLGSADGEQPPPHSPEDEAVSRPLPGQAPRVRSCLCHAATGRCADDCLAEPGSEYCPDCAFRTGGTCH